MYLNPEIKLQYRVSKVAAQQIHTFTSLLSVDLKTEVAQLRQAKVSMRSAEMETVFTK
ncbi:hypothetical protein N474_08720 [Pseudoalteromonas luteoviolacea CPMOR-2]|uniref:Uncharacterized protein n=1 Tax=Pseudoalteromonas luteoviolacea DSM 6061 TaxID=1365250 RepID=A0A166XGR6_9GAMM|nr:hypothetical protein N475_12600 [Pseudoalteromonas luteoviolacea DSM 6061]KZN57273.1 hypothetical protein N474_08720 [Pseudoalteromonas luteoviolacea CPMOR-2]MBE0387922.1 hypothetical protein [Pseudoalteromonas luteoviolacea DSM 6061]